MKKNHKLQASMSSIMAVIILLLGIFGGKFLFDTIYLFLVQESVAADASLLNKILSYIGTYNILHYSFIIVGLILIIISIYTFYRDRSYKVAFFVIATNIVVVTLTFMNTSLSRIMTSASKIIPTTENIESLFVLGKDFVSVVATASSTLPADASKMAMKSLGIDIFILLIYLLLFIVLVLRTADIRRYEK